MDNVKNSSTSEIDAALTLLMLKYPEFNSAELNELPNERILSLTPINNNLPIASTSGYNNQNREQSPAVSPQITAINLSPSSRNIPQRNNQNEFVQSRPAAAASPQLAAVNPSRGAGVPQRNNMNRRKRAMMAACHDLIHEYLALKAKNSQKRSG